MLCSHALSEERLQEAQERKIECQDRRRALCAPRRCGPGRLRHDRPSRPPRLPQPQPLPLAAAAPLRAARPSPCRRPAPEPPPAQGPAWRPHQRRRRRRPAQSRRSRSDRAQCPPASLLSRRARGCGSDASAALQPTTTPGWGELTTVDCAKGLATSTLVGERILGARGGGQQESGPIREHGTAMRVPTPSFPAFLALVCR